MAVASKPTNEPKASIRLTPKPLENTTLGENTSSEKPWKPLSISTPMSSASRTATSASSATPSTLALSVTSKYDSTATAATARIAHSCHERWMPSTLPSETLAKKASAPRMPIVAAL